MVMHSIDMDEVNIGRNGFFDKHHHGRICPIYRVISASFSHVSVTRNTSPDQENNTDWKSEFKWGATDHLELKELHLGLGRFQFVNGKRKWRISMQWRREGERLTTSSSGERSGLIAILKFQSRKVRSTGNWPIGDPSLWVIWEVWVELRDSECIVVLLFWHNVICISMVTMLW